MTDTEAGRPGGLSSGDGAASVSTLRASIPDAGLWHYAKYPLALEDRLYTQDAELSKFNKPHGLWVSVEGDDDWPEWCVAENFGVSCLAYRHRVSLLPGGQFIFISSSAELLEFEAEYGRARAWGAGDRWTEICIDWPLIAEAYDGIFIAPYEWKHRLENDWYYPWDCASGCVWNVDAISLGLAQPTEIEPCAQKDGS